MKYLPYDHGRNVSLLVALWRSVRQRVAGALSPIGRRLHLGSRPRRILSVVAVLVSLVVQLVLVFLVGELIDLSISLMELWAELARKHLELQLDTT